VNVGILLTFGKHLLERIISLRGEGGWSQGASSATTFQDRKVISHMNVFLEMSLLPPCLRYIYCIFELFWWCGIFAPPFIIVMEQDKWNVPILLNI